MDLLSNLDIHTIQMEHVDCIMPDDCGKGEKVYKGQKKKNSFNIIKRPSLNSNGDESRNNLATEKTLKTHQMSFDDRLTFEIPIRDFPHYFQLKYLGKQSCSGLSGLDVIKKPVKHILVGICKMSPGKDIALVQMKVTNTTISIEEHPQNKTISFQMITWPISILSYAVQHPKYHRLIAIIEARRLSANHYLTDCHVVICVDENHAIALASSLKRAFYSASAHNNGAQKEEFIDLRTTSDILFKNGKDSEA